MLSLIPSFQPFSVPGNLSTGKIEAFVDSYRLLFSLDGRLAAVTILGEINEYAFVLPRQCRVGIQLSLGSSSMPNNIF